MTAVSEVVPGVWRLGTDFFNWYLVESDGGLTAVDAGVPGLGRTLEEDLRSIGRSPGDITALVLTHGDLDHIGLVPRLQGVGARVLAHADEVDRLRKPGPKSGDASPRAWLKNLWRPRSAAMVVKSAPYAGRAKPVTPDATFVDGDVLDVPGRPRVIATVGHTPGHCALLFEERSALFVGDALTTHPLLRRGPGISLMPRFMNEDDARTLRALDALEPVSADVMLFGHGDPWRGGVAAALAGGRRSASG